MTLVVTDAIVLHAFDYLESSRILRLVTREAGVRSVLARGARKSQQALRRGARSLRAGHGRAADRRPGRDLDTLAAFDVARARPQLAADLARFAGASTIAELTLRFARDAADPGLFDAVAVGARRRSRVAHAGLARATSTLGGAWRILAELGVAPTIDNCAECHATIAPDAPAMFSHPAGGALCARCGRLARGGRTLPPTARDALRDWLCGESHRGHRRARAFARTSGCCASSSASISPTIVRSRAFDVVGARHARTAAVASASMILGTAGHIDHGKTTLVRALTGVDTDRLPEEKRAASRSSSASRRSTLDGIGTIGVVDVPGHEAFVRTMVAGATGIDLALARRRRGRRRDAADARASRDPRAARRAAAASSRSRRPISSTTSGSRSSRRMCARPARARFPDAPIIAASAHVGRGHRRAACRASPSSRERCPRRATTICFDCRSIAPSRSRAPAPSSPEPSGRARVERDATVRILPGDRTARVRGIQGARRAARRCADRARARRSRSPASTSTTCRAARRSSLIRTGIRRRSFAPTSRSCPAPTSRFARAPGFACTSERRRSARVSSRDRRQRRRAVRGARSCSISRCVLRAGDRFVLRTSAPLNTIAGGVVTDPYAPRRAAIWPAGLSSVERLDADGRRGGRAGDRPASAAGSARASHRESVAVHRRKRRRRLREPVRRTARLPRSASTSCEARSARRGRRIPRRDSRSSLECRHSCCERGSRRIRTSSTRCIDAELIARARRRAAAGALRVRDGRRRSTPSTSRPSSIALSRRWSGRRRAANVDRARRRDCGADRRAAALSRAARRRHPRRRETVLYRRESEAARRSPSRRDADEQRSCNTGGDSRQPWRCRGST